MQPGESRVMHFKVKARNRGFENSVTNREIVQNGTFLTVRWRHRLATSRRMN